MTDPLRTVVFVSCVLLALGCATARRGEAVVGALPMDDPAVERGCAVFMERCHKCHPGGEAGLGPSLNDKPLPDFMKRLQVRVGMGVMPGFDESLITQAQMDDLLQYMSALRAHEAAPRAVAEPAMVATVR